MNSLKSDLSSLKEEVASGKSGRVKYVDCPGDTYTYTGMTLYGINGKITNAVGKDYSVPRNCMSIYKIINIVPIDPSGYYCSQWNPPDDYVIRYYTSVEDLRLITSKGYGDNRLLPKAIRIYYISN